MNMYEQLKSPESKTLEFKRDASSLDPIMRTLVAFANTAGGMLIIGVEDRGNIIGVSDPAELQDRVANAVAHSITPHLLCDFEWRTAEDKTIVVVKVSCGIGPYYWNQKGSEKGIYIRLGATTRQASDVLIKELLDRAHGIPFVDRRCIGAELKDLDQAYIETLFPALKQDPTKLRSLGLACEDAGNLYPTNAGVILFGLPDKRIQYFPNTQISCARFAGIDKSDFIDRLELDCYLIQALEEISKFIRRNTRMGARFEEFKRIDIPEYPVDAIREILINAIAHANYEEKGSKFKVAIFDDRIEIQSPGVFPLSVTLEDFKSGASHLRNRTIAKVLSRLELMEEWGRGYKKIATACEGHGLNPPKWEELGSLVRVTLYNAGETAEDQPGVKKGLGGGQVGVRQGLSKLDAPIEGNQAKLIDTLSNFESGASLIELMSATGYKSRSKLRENYLVPLLDLGLIEMTEKNSPSSPTQKYRLSEEGQAYHQTHCQKGES